MRKFKSSLSIFVLLSLLLVGCGDTPSPTQQPVVESLPKPEIIIEPQSCELISGGGGKGYLLSVRGIDDTNIDEYKWQATANGNHEPTGQFTPDNAIGKSINYMPPDVDTTFEISVVATAKNGSTSENHIPCHSTVSSLILISTPIPENIPSATVSLNILIKPVLDITLSRAKTTQGTWCSPVKATGSIDTNGNILLAGLGANKEYTLSLNGEKLTGAKLKSASFNQVLCGKDECPKPNDHWDFMTVITDADGKVNQKLITFPFNMPFSKLESDFYNTKFFVKDKAAKYCIALGIDEFIFHVTSAP